MSKGAKIGIGIAVVVVILLILYFVFRTPAPVWKETPGGDISGTQYDIAREPFTTLDDAKKRAAELGAKAFLANPAGAYVIYKNAKSPVSTVQGASYTLYVLQS